MRWKYLIFLILVFLPFVNSGSVGISPAYYIENFEANLQKEFDFRTFNSNKSEGVGIILEGSLAEYANASEDFLLGGGNFKVNLSLPESFEKPGTHILYVRIFESKNVSKNFGGIASIRAPIKILVPYPGKYIESELLINNINEKENAKYKLDIKNLGTENLTLNTKLEIFKINSSGEKLIEEELNGLFLETKRVLNIEDDIETNNLEPGIYFAKATIDYGELEIINTTFKIGEFLVDIIDYDFIFETGKINEFNILVENKWNTQIENIFAEVTITNQGDIVSTFRTVSMDTSPWEVKNITGFFDAEKLAQGRYLANINLYYGNESSYKLVAIYLQDPAKEKNYLKYVLIGVALISMIAIAGFFILFNKIRELKKELGNEKKK